MTLLKARTRADLSLMEAVLEGRPRKIVIHTSLTQPRRREPAINGSSTVLGTESERRTGLEVDVQGLLVLAMLEARKTGVHDSDFVEVCNVKVSLRSQIGRAHV